MLRERVARDIFVFTSDLYLQVTSSAIFTPDGVIIIDTLPFPQETREMLRFVKRHSKSPIRYVVLTHSHPDHTYGTWLVGAEVIAHERCRRILEKTGERLLETDRAQNPALAEVEIKLPETVFDRGSVSLHLGKKTIILLHTPGHTSDGISIYAKEDKVLFAGDLVMPVPYIVDGDRHAMRDSLKKIDELALDNIVQGHGDVLLRGEVPEAIETSLLYLDAVEHKVEEQIAEGTPKSALRQFDIERFHKSRIPLNGLAEELHQSNLSYLYDLLSMETSDNVERRRV